MFTLVEKCSLVKCLYESTLCSSDLLFAVYLTIIGILIRWSKHTVKLCVHEVLVHLLLPITCFGSVKRKYKNKLSLEIITPNAKA